ncbi:MAG: hypothetical protein KJ941_04780 [Bacteroidetes bacterium]|nr:hypothetical protein [Bacteroidota bacterium]
MGKLFTSTLVSFVFVLLSLKAISQTNDKGLKKIQEKPEVTVLINAGKKSPQLVLAFESLLKEPAVLLICDDFGREKLRFQLQEERCDYVIELAPLPQGNYQWVLQEDLKEMHRASFKLKK